MTFLSSTNWPPEPASGEPTSYPRKHYEASPVANWSVFSAKDLRRLVELLDAFPPMGRKRAEYDIWREAVGPLGASPAATQAHLRELRAKLLTARDYKAPS